MKQAQPKERLIQLSSAHWLCEIQSWWSCFFTAKISSWCWFMKSWCYWWYIPAEWFFEGCNISESLACLWEIRWCNAYESWESCSEGCWRPPNTSVVCDLTKLRLYSEMNVLRWLKIYLTGKKVSLEMLQVYIAAYSPETQRLQN